MSKKTIQAIEKPSALHANANANAKKKQKSKNICGLIFKRNQVL